MGKGVMTLRVALRTAEQLGMRVEKVPRTGEVRVWDGDRPLTINARRKDAPIILMVAIRRRQQGRER